MHATVVSRCVHRTRTGLTSELYQARSPRASFYGATLGTYMRKAVCHPRSTGHSLEGTLICPSYMPHSHLGQLAITHEDPRRVQVVFRRSVRRPIPPRGDGLYSEASRRWRRRRAAGSTFTSDCPRDLCGRTAQCGASFLASRTPPSPLLSCPISVAWDSASIHFRRAAAPRLIARRPPAQLPTQARRAASPSPQRAAPNTLGRSCCRGKRGKCAPLPIGAD